MKLFSYSHSFHTRSPFGALSIRSVSSVAVPVVAIGWITDALAQLKLLTIQNCIHVLYIVLINGHTEEKEGGFSSSHREDAQFLKVQLHMQIFLSVIFLCGVSHQKDLLLKARKIIPFCLQSCGKHRLEKYFFDFREVSLNSNFEFELILSVNKIIFSVCLWKSREPLHFAETYKRINYFNIMSITIIIITIHDIKFIAKWDKIFENDWVKKMGFGWEIH